MLEKVRYPSPPPLNFACADGYQTIEANQQVSQ